ncbi:GatB/YqeY domain-containing protein, partial [Candidatus Bathyarchaeota archaeon]|nr:GatB/YqeY domain-containing protein [Candidatus Bathyarchaeota archaeon]
RSLFKRVGSGELAKEALPNVFVWLSKNEEKTIGEAITDLDLKMLSKEELEEIVDTKISENKETVKKLGKKSFRIIMGLVMKDVRGKADPKVVGEIIKRKIGQ